MQRYPRNVVTCGFAIGLPLCVGVIMLAVHLAFFESSFFLGELTLIVEAIAMVVLAWLAGALTAQWAAVDRPVAVTSCTLVAAVVLWVVVVGILGQVGAMVLVAAVMSFPDVALVVIGIVVVSTAAAMLFVLTGTVLLGAFFGRLLRR